MYRKISAVFVLLSICFSANAISTKNKTQKDSLLEVIQKAKGEEKVNSYIEIASLYSGEYDSVYFYTEQAIKTSKEINFQKGIALALTKRGSMLLEEGEYKQSLKWYQKAKDVYSNIGDSIGISYTLNNIGFCYMLISDYESALSAFNEVLAFGDSSIIAESYLNIATLLENSGNDFKALEYNEKSIKIFENLKDKKGLAGNYLIFSRILTNQEEYNRAMEYLQKAITINKDLGATSSYSNNLNELGLLYSKIGEEEKALEHFMKSLEIHKELSHKEGMISNFFNMCISYMDMSDFEQAKYCWHQLDSVSSNMEDRFLKCDMLWLASRFEEHAGNKTKEIELLEESLEVALELSAWKRIADISKKLYRVSKELTDYEKTLKYNEIYLSAKDSLINFEKAKEIERLKFSTDFIKMENDLLLKRTRIESLEREKENAWLINYLIAFCSLTLISFAGFAIFKQRRTNKYQKRALESEKAVMKLKLEKEVLKKNQLNEIIAYKNKQLTDLAIHITEKNDLMERFKDNIRTVKKAVKEKNVKDNLQDMLVSISQDIDFNKERLEFYKEIEDLNQSFLYSLSNKYPDLTDRELKLAALLRINLSTKRIAMLLGLSPTSIDIYRHNLRKKLNLDKSTSLNNFFNEMES